MNQQLVEQAVALALAEDIGSGDITTESVVPAGVWASAEIVAKAEGIVAGVVAAVTTFRQMDAGLSVDILAHDGARTSPGARVLRVQGDARSILTAERTALNFMQRLSGIATQASAFVEACAGTKARIVDTRKTVPGLRALDKYAVSVGGASNHRWGLYDGILIKENHIRAGGGVLRAITNARALAPHTLRIEIECDSLEQVKQALEARADIILLDNMSTAEMSQAVRMIGGAAIVEASGEMNLPRIPEVAATGVDLISVGSLTHSVTGLDLSLQIIDWKIPGEFAA